MRSDEKSFKRDWCFGHPHGADLVLARNQYIARQFYDRANSMGLLWSHRFRSGISIAGGG
jgi:hypothetical protein